MSGYESAVSVEPRVDPGREMRSGGAILFAGAVLFWITIGLESWVGWTTGGDRTVAELAGLLIAHWASLRWIWAAQALAALLFAVSALVLLRSRALQDRWLPAAALWSTTAVGSVVVVVAYGLTLGGYPPALAAFEQDPDLFATVSGAIRSLYFPGVIVAWLGYLPLLVREGVAEEGAVPRSWLVGAGVAVAGAIAAGASGWLHASTAGAAGFLLPGVLGLGIWRAGRRLAPDPSAT